MSLPNSKLYLQLYNFLGQFLPKFLPDNVVQKMLSKEAFETFKRAFTHQSKSNFHYQLLETLGDASITPCFYTYILKHFNIKTPGDMTNLKNYFLSKSVFAGFSDKFGFTKYIQLNDPLTIDHKEDVFESFCGALREIGDNYVGKYTGQMFVNMFIDWVFDQVEIDTRNINQYIDPVQILKQDYFDHFTRRGERAKMNWDIRPTNDEQYIAKIYHNTKLLGVATDPDQKEAKRLAALDAIKKLGL